MCRNKDDYLTHEKQLDLRKISPSFEEALRDCSKNGVDVCIWTVAALATVLKRKINVRCPDVEGSIVPQQLKYIELLPVRNANDSFQPMDIMWTRSIEGTTALWTPNHFVPILHG